MMNSYLDHCISGYRLLRSLGRGDASEIYLGEHELLHTQAAIKLFDGRRSSNEVAKFLAQASLLTHLSHPHIIQVLDFGMFNEMAFLVMNYAPHGTLRQRHPKGSRLPLPLVLQYVKQIASALQYIHLHQLIHRDIKPQNMLLGTHSEVMLSDFGIAIVSQSSDPLYSGYYDFEGTVLYAAPEQLQGTPRRSSDQYALGIMIYEWLCGDWPFSGSFDEVVHQHLFEAPPPFHEKGLSLPASIEEVVLRALAKDSADRFATVEEFSCSLEKAITSEERNTAPALRLAPTVLPQLRRQFMSPLPFSAEHP